MAETTMMRSIASSNLPDNHKSAFARWYEKVTGESTRRFGLAKTHVAEGAHAFRQGVESAAVGAVLGIAHVELPTGLDLMNGKLPIDGLAGFALMVGGVVMANDPLGVGQDLRNAGAAALTVLSFRKGYEFMAAKKQAKGGLPGGGFSAHHGESLSSGDPVIDAARALD